MNYSLTHFRKSRETFCNRTSVMLNKKNEDVKIVKWQSKLTFIGIHKSYENHVTYAFKQNEFLQDKPFFSRFNKLELNKLSIPETYYDKLQL